MTQTRSRRIARVTRTRSGKIVVATSHRATSSTQPSTTTRTGPRKIAGPKATAKTAKAVQKSIGPNLAIGYAEGSNNAKTAGIGDAASTRDAGNTTEDHAANNPASSTTGGPAPSDSAPTTSTTDAASTYEISGTTEQDAPPVASTQPANTTTNNSASPPSTTTDAIEQMSTITNDRPEVNTTTNTTTNSSAPPPSTITAATITAATTTAATTTATTADATPSPHDAIEQMSTIANDSPVNTTTNNSAPESAPAKARRSRRSKKTGDEPIVTKPHSPDDTIIVDGESIDDAPIASSTKQVLLYRQRCVENMKFALDNLTAYIGSTADSDQSGDYDNVRVGQKRSFQEFITSELDDSDQPEVFANDLVCEIRKYQRMLRRTQAF